MPFFDPPDQKAPQLQPYQRARLIVSTLTLLSLLLSLAAWLAWQAQCHRLRITPLNLPVPDPVWHALQSRETQPCRQYSSSRKACLLVDNVVQTRRQMQDCGFEAVIVVPLPALQTRQGLASTAAVDFKLLPYPVVACSFLPGLPNAPGAFNSTALDAPPCVRPAAGRDDVAYTSFILQNYAHLPPHVFFIHGHESSWHQDANTSAILAEFCGRPLPPSTYVSLNNVVTRDWRHIFCLLGLCASARKLTSLRAAWRDHLGHYLGPMPPDLTHFCCSQFLVSRSRILLRPRQLYLNMLTFSLDAYPAAHTLSTPCHGRSCEMPGAVMEVLWPFIFGEGVPLAFDQRLRVTYPTEQLLSTETLMHYRYAWSTDEWMRDPDPP